jgi:glycosyltransferase involved in cell wall biosynthesis
MFQRDIRHIVETEQVDVLVVAYSAYMTGFPPFNLNIPIVFDYLDCAEWTNASPHVKPYIKESEAVFCVSALAEEQARRFSDNAIYLPNGADVNALQHASGKRVREKYGIASETPVVSLIGLMDSPYLVEAVQQAKKSIPNLKCLLVGRSDALAVQLDTIPNAEDTFTYVGPVPYEDVASFFAASDVGLYPVPGISYDDGRSPIKVFEYTAAGKPVVSPSIREVRRLDFNNVVYAEPNAEAFAEGIVRAFQMDLPRESKISRYDWHHLSEQFDQHLKACV